ncbi:MAG: HVO_A0114 family putative DNA-binding protein [Bdellovibrionota bacterium]
MKTFTFRYAPNEPSIRKRVLDAARGKTHVRPDEMVCSSLKTLLQVASESRLELFESILREKPSSIYDLAEKIGKSQPYVLKEARVLEGLGLIRLVQEKDGGRERLRPEALYSKIVIDCGFEQKKEAS